MEEQNLSTNVNESILPTSNLAMISLISAILGFTFFPIAGGIVALVTGYMARNETRSIPPKASGDGLATAGIVMGWIQAGLLALGVCCVVASILFGFGWLTISGNQ